MNGTAEHGNRVDRTVRRSDPGNASSASSSGVANGRIYSLISIADNRAGTDRTNRGPNSSYGPKAAKLYKAEL